MSNDVKPCPSCKGSGCKRCNYTGEIDWAGRDFQKNK